MSQFDQRILNYAKTHPDDVLSSYFRNETMFDVLVGIAYTDRDSTLTYINPFGLPNTTSSYQAIGIGARYSKAFLEKAWVPEMRMEQVAELGYFIIRYIEQLRLDLSVGLHNTRPQVWYIPNCYEENEAHVVTQNDDRLATDPELEQMSIRVEKRLRRHEKHLVKLFEE